MNYNELLEKYNLLSAENHRLVKENYRLKAQLGQAPPEPPPNIGPVVETEENLYKDKATEDKTADAIPFSGIANTSNYLAKIKLFVSLFRGRKDVYAKRWENKRKEKFGYIFVCLNQWRPGVCGRPKISCSHCKHRTYVALDESVIENHLKGNIVAGIYPMLPDDTCCFLAMDFDEGDWQNDILMVREVCREFNIPIAVERSRSGNGGHAWFFFEKPISAALARKFGTALLTFSMGRRHEIQFKSYDRLFPSQDTLPRGGLGNLIALPLQKMARKNGNSEFVDENFIAYVDQWAFLSTISKLSEERLEHLISELCRGHELGVLKIDEEEAEAKPWETHKGKIELQKSDFPRQLDIVKANMLFIPKIAISQRGLNRLKRLASFKNPMFYKQQAMRLSTFGHERIISCADETKEYLCLPRGCEPELSAMFEDLGTEVRFIDKTCNGKNIKVKFTGQLRDEQPQALEKLLQYDNGILSGTTAFGKTVVAIKLIAERKVNTLILVDKISLLAQWQAKLSEFLTIDEPLPAQSGVLVKKRGRKKKTGVIGQLGGGKNSLSGIVDIAVVQSLSRQGVVKDLVKDYAMIIADECHHVSALTYEQILKTAMAKYVYGLTATPMRKDGWHPILFMHCGPIRYRDNPIKQAEKRPFDHYIVPRFTALRTPFDRDEKDLSIQDLYAEITDNNFRNQQIVEDVLKNYSQGRNCIILSLRTAHVELLAARLMAEVPEVIILMGGMGKSLTQQAFQALADIPADKNFILVATGNFIGEGFDEPRLDTLFLAMPISWKGTLQQYAGRLHRLFQTKKEVRIYDYVDIQVKMLEKMYQKRLNGYAAMGYKAKSEEIADAPLDIIFNKENFLPVFNQDIVAAEKEILIVSPFVRKRRTQQMVEQLKIPISKNVRVS
ncbi:MAG: DEAD/DEAH box helicase family protein, partial [Deltaproteobacteria bacterium]|nr:DEAD/DEAH box helicase family protein [Deltaproteobacteria bacterium]